MDRANEQFSNGSRRTSDSGDNLQLEEINVELPNIEEQIYNIEQAEVEENTSVFTAQHINGGTKSEISTPFYFSQEMIDSYLKSGSGFQEGKYRIYEQFIKSLSSQDNINFLKNEYGEGGSTSIPDFERVGQWHNRKGIRLYKGYGDNAPEILLTWNKVEQRIKELIKLDRYLNSYEKEHYPIWLDEQDQKRKLYDNKQRLISEEKEKPFEERFYNLLMERDIFDTSEDDLSDEEMLDNLRNDLSNVSSILEIISYLGEVRKSEDGNAELIQEIDYYITKLSEIARNFDEYDFNIDDVVYIGTDEYQINSIGISDVNLFDPRYPLFGRTMPKEEFERKVKDNPANDNLKVANKRLNEILDNIYNPKEKFRRNIEAIKVLKKCEDENRYR